MALDLGWNRLKNGALLEGAEAEGFQVMPTSDKNLKYQQNLNSRKIALVMLPASRWPLIEPHLPEIVEAVDNVGRAATMHFISAQTS
jgi:lipid A disaccharide synthetase